MESEWLLILPPIFTLTFAVITRRVVLALLLGCLLAAYVSTDFSIVQSLLLFIKKFLSTTQLDQWHSLNGIWQASNPQLSVFVIFMGILINTIEKTGGYKAFNVKIEKFVHQKQQAELAAIALSHCVSIDGYLSTLTVGSVMRPLMDKYNSTRIKLAYIARSLAIPLCSINPLSTWMALILLQLHVAKIHSVPDNDTLVIADPLSIYFVLIPFMFYSLLTLISVWFVVSKQISFGAMGALEHTNQNNPLNHHTSNDQENKDYIPNFYDFFLPIFFLVGFTLIGFLYTGGWKYLGGMASFATAMQNIQVAHSLLFSSFASMLIYFIYMTLRKAITFRDWWKLIKEGTKIMLPSVAILNLAWTFGSIETYSGIIPTLLKEVMPNDAQMNWTPLLFFITAVGVSTTTGSSWATISLLFPIVTTAVVSLESAAAPLLLEELPLLLPSLGAVVSGAVAGDQLSPISDTSIVVCASTQCLHGDHTHSQFTYGIPVIFAAGLAYAISGWLIHWSPVLSILFPLSVSALLLTAYYLYRESRTRWSFATKTISS